MTALRGRSKEVTKNRNKRIRNKGRKTFQKRKEERFDDITQQLPVENKKHQEREIWEGSAGGEG